VKIFSSSCRLVDHVPPASDQVSRLQVDHDDLLVADVPEGFVDVSEHGYLGSQIPGAKTTFFRSSEPVTKSETSELVHEVHLVASRPRAERGDPRDVLEDGGVDPPSGEAGHRRPAAGGRLLPDEVEERVLVRVDVPGAL